ncbi:hypothetical protein EVAR_94593_1 [Eumeta japonica]|uniref:Uncharacterized protein n=1 Tax=Eumeta variegata TaxID=151549 RepID=A0A4C1UTE9_EUMVA|nr:hypothetical protein EVAR_94593_1 [Eumeta japonica]
MVVQSALWYIDFPKTYVFVEDKKRYMPPCELVSDAGSVVNNVAFRAEAKALCLGGHAQPSLPEAVTAVALAGPTRGA